MSQQALTMRSQVEVQLSYWLYLPQDYAANAGHEWPLILFLHGAGERGDDPAMVKRNGIPRLLEQGSHLPFVVVSPQCPAHSMWWAESLAVMALLDQVCRTHTVDANRLYLTGLSLGGYGTWHLAALYPDRFAAIAPICGGGIRFHGFPERVSLLKHVPVWAFHGAKDPSVPVEESAKMVRALEECGGEVRFTVYPEAKHDSWTETYDNPELYEWFLSHSLQPTEGNHAH
jgi:predicted peptidase